MNEENIHVDTLVTEDMNKKELYDYAKYLEYRKEELLNINRNLQQRVEQLEKGIEDYIEELSWVQSTDEELRNVKIINRLKKIIKGSE